MIAGVIVETVCDFNIWNWTEESTYSVRGGETGDDRSLEALGIPSYFQETAKVTVWQMRCVQEARLRMLLQSHLGHVAL